jgi:high frequency lysogenization protein
MNQAEVTNVTLGLAGMLQAVALIREFTQTGKVDEAAFAASMHSIFQLDAKDIPTIYGGIAGLRLGLSKLVHTFDLTHTMDKSQHRYLLSLIHLQKKLSRSPKALAQLSERLKQTQKQVNYFSATHPVVIANLADVYLRTISRFRFRIIIMGNQRVLHSRENMEKIRALLLAGLRAAVLWRQMGGSRLQILFSRVKIKAAATKLLHDIENTPLSDKEPA